MSKFINRNELNSQEVNDLIHRKVIASKISQEVRDLCHRSEQEFMADRFIEVFQKKTETLERKVSFPLRYHPRYCALQRIDWCKGWTHFDFKKQLKLLLDERDRELSRGRFDQYGKIAIDNCCSKWLKAFSNVEKAMERFHDIWKQTFPKRYKRHVRFKTVI